MAKIMLVDDNKEVRIVAGRGLIRAGHEVIESESGFDCLEKLKSGMHPDLIFLDVMMPEMHGWEVCSMIKTDAALKDIVVCMLTVKDSNEDIKKSLSEVGAEWHLSKPVPISKIVETVDFLLITKDSTFHSSSTSDFFTRNL